MKKSHSETELEILQKLEENDMIETDSSESLEELSENSEGETSQSEEENDLKIEEIDE